MRYFYAIILIIMIIFTINFGDEEVIWKMNMIFVMLAIILTFGKIIAQILAGFGIRSGVQIPKKEVLVVDGKEINCK